MLYEVITNWLEYIPFILLAKLVRALPRNAALAFGRNLGTVGRWLQPRRVKISRDNLWHAFPELTDAERESIIRKMFSHLGGGFVEMLRLDMSKNAAEIGRDFIVTGEA